MGTFVTGDYLDLDHAPVPALFERDALAWEALRRIDAFFAEKSLDSYTNDATVLGSCHIGERVSLGKGTIVEPGAVIMGPAVIGENCTIRAGAYFRENVIVGDGAFLGNSSEFKNCIIFDNVEAPHFNYVGNSVLGFRAHLGAGVILANFRLDRDLGGVSIRTEDGVVPTGLDKFGAIIGDRTDIGSNSVVSPGSIIGRDCRLYPGSHWRGVLSHNKIVKVRQTQEIVVRS